jgi:uncharacterized surface protein with fasciclin (FAS1) repeats
MRKLFSLAMALTVLFAAVSFGNVHAQTDKKPTIVDIAAGNKDFTTLVAAVKAAGLDTVLADPTFGPVTVFAPTNAAFDAALKALNLTADQLLANKELLTSVLLYHVVPGAIKSDVVVTLNGAKVATALWNETLTVAVADGKVKVNSSNVTAVDLEASNGVVHVIDAVLVPKAGPANYKLIADASGAMGKAEKDIIGTAGGAANLKTLVAAVSAAPDVVTYLTSKNNGFTVFAPSDTAFAGALKALNMEASALLADKATLTEILAYHVIPWPFPASVLANYDGVLIGTALPDTAVQITVKDGKVLVNGAGVETADVMTKNGIVHIINDVLLPPALVKAMTAGAATPVATAAK